MADLDTLLVRTSRTFALAIPALPEPTQQEVRVAYLLFRIADTFEDATLWQPAERAEALIAFRSLLRDAADSEAEDHARRWRSRPPVLHEGYVELVGELPAVLRALNELGTEAQLAIRRHVDRTAEGMARFAGRPGALQLGTVEELREYCYVVAGIVGEMLTDLFVLDRAELAPVGPYLWERARYFGEGLQLTNILKDSAGDFEEGRTYLPHEVPRDEVFRIAREDLALAVEYVLALEGASAPKGILAFVAMPVLLAWKTLERVEADGPGAKLTRPEVAQVVMEMQGALERGESLMAVAETS